MGQEMGSTWDKDTFEYTTRDQEVGSVKDKETFNNNGSRNWVYLRQGDIKQQ